MEILLENGFRCISGPQWLQKFRYLPLVSGGSDYELPMLPLLRAAHGLQGRLFCLDSASVGDGWSTVPQKPSFWTKLGRPEGLGLGAFESLNLKPKS